MAEVLSPTPPPTSSEPISPPPTTQPPEASADALGALPRRPAPRERLPSHSSNRLSAFTNRTSRSRPGSTVTNVPPFPSSLSYTLVRDFAWPSFHPLHYGAPEGGLSGATTPGSEAPSGGRRLSDPLDLSQGGGWGPGAWGGDGVLYGDPDSTGESLPSTSFGADDDGFPSDASGQRRHRKSKSYASISDYERGRRRESAGCRRSRPSGAGGDDMFMLSGQQSDPAGRDGLRLSRGYSGPQHARPTDDSGRSRADSHFQTMMRSSSPTTAAQRSSEAEENDFPLSTIAPNSPPHSPQRQSIGPEDEELYAGRSLALYPFEPENSNELRLREGQVILVAYRHGQGWLVAEDPETGEQGLVPEEYVRLLSELPHYDETTGQFLDPDEVEGQDEGQTESSLDAGGDEEAEEGGITLGEATSGKQEPRVDEAYQPSALGLDPGMEEGVQEEKGAASR